MGETRICGDVLLVPIWLTGHFNPMMYVAKRLMKRGLTVTMVLPEDETDFIKSHLKGEGMEGFNLELVESRKKFKPAEPSLLLRESLSFEMACEPFLKRVLAEQQAGGEGPKCMIADQFMGWTQAWAMKLQILRYVSIATPATFGYAMYNYSVNVANGILESEDEDPFLDLPGFPGLRLSDLPTAAKKSPKFITSNGDTFDGAAGILMNTFYDLESPTLDCFDAHIKSKGGNGPKLLPIGPMLPPEFFSEGKYSGTATESECLRWLDTRPASSVVYIAFGTTGRLSPAETLVVANGLEASGESFLWVLLMKDSADVSTLLPPGFQDRTKDRGFVYTKFAPQLEIVAHPATGGFLVHCGWNSSLESICRGVPMIGWPQVADQKIGCRVLVDQAKVAVEVRSGLSGKAELVTSAEVETALKLLMRQPEGQELRKRVGELQTRARAAMASDGSSTRNFNTLVKDIQSRSSRILQPQA